MTEKSNFPQDKVRELQWKLWQCAKRSKGRRFHALYDRIYRRDILWEAWKRVRRNRGAGGIDGESIATIEAQGVEDFLEEIQTDLQSGTYRPSPVKRRYIPKSDGKHRPLGIPTIKDRVVQMATKLVIEPIFEADFGKESYGFRPRRSAIDALESIRKQANRGYNYVLDADISAYFDSIDHTKLEALLKERISDRRVLKLLKKWLKVGVMEEGKVRTATAGTPQGGVISPLLSNIYLNELDREWEKHKHLGVLVRYADDFVIMCKRISQLREAQRRVQGILKQMGLKLHPEKTKQVNLGYGKEGFEFLGHRLRKRRSIQRQPDKHFMQRWPSPGAMKALRERIHRLTDVRQSGIKGVEELIIRINPIIRGWGNYYRSGNADREFNAMDSYVWKRITHWLWRRGGQRRKMNPVRWPASRLYALGLYRLQGTISYPMKATERRPSVSRVRENRTHGLKGVVLSQQLKGVIG